VGEVHLTRSLVDADRPVVVRDERHVGVPNRTTTSRIWGR
jgi:hypothetical protein